MAFYDNIKLEKGMYQTSGKTFSQALEELDPSSAYSAGETAGLDAFERQLKRFDIKVSGAGSDMVEKFFKTTDSAALFPEYVSRAVRAGLEEADLISKIVATTTKIDSLDYRTITAIPSDDEKELKKVAQGAKIPEINVRTQENLVRLQKRGRMLVSSYEAIRFQRLDLFTVTLRQIGAYIARTQLADAIHVLFNGDGNNNAVTGIATETADSLTYDDLINFWSKFDLYDLNTLLLSADSMKMLLALDEFKNPATGLNFQATGTLSTPIGAELVKTSAMQNGVIMGLDRKCALEMVKATDITTDYDKLIDRQLERAAITTIYGFAKIFPDASKLLYW